MMNNKSADVIRLSSAVHAASPEATKALEQAWQRQRQELANWQPSGGWLLDARLNARRNAVAMR
jgi:hypothetical protein